MMSLADPEKSAEGGLDPLGLYGIADELAARLCPGVRERQKRLRYLTLQAVSLALCGDFEGDRFSRDGRTEPWLVFEWHVVEGLFRWGRVDGESLSLPGIQKVSRVVRSDGAVSAATYLKTPAVFGFHGVYRLLARDLGIEEAGVLGSTGRELMGVWEREQGLAGFISSSAGPGRDLRRQWREAVEDGLKQNRTSRNPNWLGWSKVAEYLHPLQIGLEESVWLKKRLLAESAGHRGELMRFYGSREGQNHAREGSEREAHAALMEKTATKELRVLLDAIASYEHSARLAQDAYDACLVEMTHAHTAVDACRLARLKAVETASRQIPAHFARTAERLERESPELALRFSQSFDSLRKADTAADWVPRLLSHHVENQNRKSKRPWIMDQGSSWRVRPLYARKEMPAGDGRDLHAYRMAPLCGFLADMKGASA